MYIILAYDVNKKRVGKVLKICRKYLLDVQKSVFEGNLTGKQLASLKNELAICILPQEDHICIYVMESTKYVTKQEIGKVKVHRDIY